MISKLIELMQTTKYTLGYFIILIIGGFYISPFWLAFLVVWLTIILYWQYSGQLQKLTTKESKIYRLLTYLYPFLGTLIKFFILTKSFTASYFWLNRVEHSMWAMALVILLWPAWKSLQNKVSPLVLFILILSVISLFGTMVEILEFNFRYIKQISDVSAWYYSDTMFDIISNLFGASFGFLVIKSLEQKIN